MSPLGGHEPGAGAHQVSDHLTVGVEDDGAVRHLDDLVVACGAVPVRALALMAVGRLADGAPVEVEQGRRGGVDLKDHAAAPAAVAAVRAAERLELLPVNRGAAMAAVASLHPEHSVVGEFCHVCSPLTVIIGGLNLIPPNTPMAGR